MKTSLKIFLLAVCLATLPACSAQKRAQKHIRKAVALCPELVQTKAHAIDTVLTAPGYADCTLLPMDEVKQGKTVYAPTDHGTVIVRLLPGDTTLRVGFLAAPQPVRYRDTLSYAQVVVPEGTPSTGTNVWKWIACVLGGVAFGIVMLIVIALKAKIVE